MTTRDSILPHNATLLERSLEQTMGRVADVPVPLAELWDPATCPMDLLPWLAWALSTDRWEVDWSEDRKRAAVANAIELQRTKGTPASIDAVLASFDELLKMTEWFEMRPPGAPHTFDIDLPLISANGDFGGVRSSAAFAEAIIRDVTRMKPARSHFRLLQSLEGAGLVRVIGAGRITGYARGDFAADVTAEPVWDTYLTTKIGEPMLAPDGSFLMPAVGYVVTGLDYALALSFNHGHYWHGGVESASLAAFPGYSFTRSGAVYELAAAGNATVGFASGVPAIVPGVGIVLRRGTTNGLLNGRDLTAATWNKRGFAAVVTDGTPRSDGTGLASKVTVGGFNNDVYQGCAVPAAQPHKYVMIKKVSAAGILTIQSPNDGSSAWQVDFSLLGAGWELLSRHHPAVTAPPIGKSGFHMLATDPNPLTFYVDFCECLDVDVVRPPLIETTGTEATLGADILAVADAPADVDQLFIVRGVPDAGTLFQPRFATWTDGTSTANHIIDIYSFGTNAYLDVNITAAGDTAYFGRVYDYTPGVELTVVVRRLAGAWRMGVVQGGVLTWADAGAAGAFPTLTTLKPGLYAPASVCQPESPVSFVGRRLGSFDTDAKVLTALSEII